MKLTEAIKKHFSLKATVSSWVLEYWQRHGKIPTKVEPELLIEKYHSWVYACANHNATNCASANLRLYVRGSTPVYSTRSPGPRQMKALAIRGKAAADVEEITDAHPLGDLLQKANSYMTGREAIERTFLSQELLGNAHWYIEYASVLGRRIPVAFWPLLSQYVRAVPDDRDMVTGYLYGRTQNDRIALKAEEVIHFRYPNPSDIIDGLGPLQAALYAVNRLEARSSYEQAMWDNDARPSMVMHTKMHLSKEARDELRQEWDEIHRGTRNAGKIAVMQGEMTVEPLAMPPKDTEMLESARFSREEIAAVFGVPITMLELSSSNRASAAEGITQYMRDTIEPRLRRFESFINEDIVPLFDETGRLFVMYDDVVPEDREISLSEWQTWLQLGVATVNEYRATLGMPEVEWGDVPLRDPGRQAAIEDLMLNARASYAPNPSERAAYGTITKSLNPPMNQTERQISAGMLDIWGGQYEEIKAALEDQWQNL